MYYLSHDGKVEGPFTIGHLGRMWRAGDIAATAQVCMSGTEDWMDITTIEDKLNPKEPPAAQPQMRAAAPAQVARPEKKPAITLRGVLGGVLFVIGLAAAAYFWLVFDTTVESGDTRVYNLGLLNDRTTGVMIGGGAAAIGLLIACLSDRR